MARWSIPALLVLGAACPGEQSLGPTDAAVSDVAGPDQAVAESLCDGSAKARLIHVVTGGFVPSSYAFSGAYGARFFVIDGTCRFWAGEEQLSIRTGTLTPASSEAIGRRLHFTKLASLQPAVSAPPCPDAGSRILSDGTSKVSCVCQCGPPAAPEYTEIFANLPQVHRELMEGGAPADLPIRVLSVGGMPAAARPALVWPLAWSPREILIDANGPFTADSGRLVSDPGDLTALRTLREMFMGQPPASRGDVRDAAGDLFRILMRDQAPANVIQALDLIN